MAGDAARIGAVIARPRRVSAGRAVRRLLVLGGLLIAGWLLGCAAQSAHADEGAAAPAEIVAKAPMLGDAVTTVHEPEPVRRVVRAVAREAPREVPVQQVVLPKASADPVAVRKGPPAAAVGEASQAQRPARELGVRRVSKVSVDRTAVAHGVRHAVQQHQAPMKAPDHPDGGSAAGGVVPGTSATGLPDVGTWAPAPPRAALPRADGAMPPAVRTAADEPSFAPD
ncbi:hypothetical protein [Actinomadura sp. B10D3]|uniref:hypothetical protein n=1 Tax=Actinomadura sp. B10D3 TaxID=3153557 RepID=UPI00325CD4CF